MNAIPSRISSFKLLKAVAFVALLFPFFIRTSEAQSFGGIVPMPVSYKSQQGNFSLSKETVITCDRDDDSSSVRIFNDYLWKYYSLKIISDPKSLLTTQVIMLQRSAPNDLPKEGYRLTVTEKQVIIQGDDAGIFYGLQSLAQLIPAGTAAGLKIPCCEITDYPRYPWRGMMLDVSRHFFSKNEVEQFIDYLATYKLNTFHWHLTDDQGWRIEIKKYPKLTETGAFRSGTLIGPYSNKPKFDTIRYGGFYTQEEIKEVVAYAMKRKVTVVPEIEMPGHVSALVASYPELACTGGPFQVAKNWGVFADVLCPSDKTIQFMEDILTEVMDLFPSTYIHTGGDECPSTRWKTNIFCQQLMKRQNLKDASQLQGYFTKQIETFVSAHGKKMIGWQEIAGASLSPNAAIMSWQGTEAGTAAALQNHFVVMSPKDYSYFDYYQSQNPKEPLATGGFLSIEKVYSFDPTPSGLNSDQEKFILGAQGNLWTEYIPDFRQAQYMIYPRLCAMAEVVWIPKEKKNFQDFSLRMLRSQFPKFELWNVNYSKALPGVNMEVRPSEDQNGLVIKLTTYDPNSMINYNESSYENEVLSATNHTNFEYGPIYFRLRQGVILNAIAKNEYQVKSDELVQQFSINKATGKKITLGKDPSLKYNNGGAFTLVNGISGHLPWNGSDWLGFEGENATATIDMGTGQSLTKVSVGVLSDEASWIYLPKQVELQVSNDGIAFKSVGKKTIDLIKKGGGRKVLFIIPKTSARYVKIIATNYGTIPSGKKQFAVIVQADFVNEIISISSCRF